MINKQEVKHIAKLARLGLTEKEISRFQKELSLILDYIEKLKEVDVSEVELMSHSTLVENVMREDKDSEKLKAKNGKLMALAPETKNGYFKTEPIRAKVKMNAVHRR